MLVYVAGRHWLHMNHWQGTGHWQHASAHLTFKVNTRQEFWVRSAFCSAFWCLTDLDVSLPAEGAPRLIECTASGQTGTADANLVCNSPFFVGLVYGTTLSVGVQGRKYSGCWNAWHQTDNSGHARISVKYDGAWNGQG